MTCAVALNAYYIYSTIQLDCRITSWKSILKHFTVHYSRNPHTLQNISVVNCSTTVAKPQRHAPITLLLGSKHTHRHNLTLPLHLNTTITTMEVTTITMEVTTITMGVTTITITIKGIERASGDGFVL